MPGARAPTAGIDELVGDGQDMHEIQRVIEVSSGGLKKSVKCVGWVEHSEISKYLSALDLAVFPFTNDYCSPLKLFEYLGAGLPTIGPKTSAVTEVFEDSVHLKLIEHAHLVISKIIFYSVLYVFSVKDIFIMWTRKFNICYMPRNALLGICILWIQKNLFI